MREKSPIEGFTERPTRPSHMLMFLAFTVAAVEVFSYARICRFILTYAECLCSHGVSPFRVSVFACGRGATVAYTYITLCV